MRWQGRRQSGNIEDVRGRGGGGFRIPIGYGRGGGMVRRAGGGGIGMLILVVVLMLVFGVNPMELLQEGGGSISVPGETRQAGTRTGGEAAGEGSDEARAFVATVLAETEDTWDAIFAQAGATYRDPTLVLFTGQVRSACGFADAAVGPFYCPNDQKIYLDLAFYDELRSRFRAPGDFAEAYVLAHEVGHHVQNLIGILPEFARARAQASEREANAMSVLVELQADCFAGIWANRTGKKGILEEGDIEEALNAASQIGDDMIQKRGQGHVVPDSFTHGSSAQRVRWFRQGYETGDLDACDTRTASAR
ncbi:KPN_02809 family neutral zinc metallopeptidase [Propylenella binzhouense]|uniref:Flagellar biosynthesis protein FlgM n=1 Tax=Propylenella binzhouense TaxID=2555902 RepID=A0A964T7C6_9HYPH|nr:neutral zinc metallopeptidase [Propylenella binzhouense]MYZ49843.1 hypothetical protein [Propylenella binzhouense]